MASQFLKLGKLKNIFAPSTPIMIGTDAKYQNEGPKRRIDGPQVFVLKLLCNAGPLTSNEIWSQYTRQSELAKQQNNEFPQYFKNWMIQNNKIKTKGYNRIGKIHLGWQINQNKAFKNIHPDLKQQLKDQLKQYKQRQALKKKQEEQERIVDKKQ